MIDIEIKYQACNLSDSLHGNINDNFKSVSFKMSNGNIFVKFILIEKTNIEEDLIDDAITEFEALQENNCVENVVIETDANSQPFEYIVYSIRNIR